MNYRITDEVPYADPHSRGTGSIVTQRKGYVLRTRGDHNHMVRHDYRCSVHGVFEVMVSSGDVSEAVRCNSTDWSMMGGWVLEAMHGKPCDELAYYQAPMVGQGWAAGTVKS